MITFNTKIAGVNIYKGQHILQSIPIDSPLILKREPTNPVDTDAVEVYYKTYKLGYVPAYRAKTITRILDSGQPIGAKLIRRGESEGYLYAEMRVFEYDSAEVVGLPKMKNGCLGMILILFTITTLLIVAY